ncbi:hypothetical protein T07_12113 [Trichinella nelsoni]|uniref:Uncharacterized protein n=1 Tax=Trichinella nelsoni TaxID=6336 RepID=A0A0V0RN76_9BILA|nr:hypothetical protein T07_12113 [Trichinella nelsoni]
MRKISDGNGQFTIFIKRETLRANRYFVGRAEKFVTWHLLEQYLTDASELHLVTYRGDGLSLVYAMYQKVAGEIAECRVVVAYSLLLWAQLLVYFIPEQFYEEELEAVISMGVNVTAAMHQMDPMNECLHGVRRLMITIVSEKRNFSEMTTVPTMYDHHISAGSITFVQAIEEYMEVPWTEQQSDHSNLSERSRKELCSVYNDEKPPLHFLDLLRENSRFSVVYGLQCTETLAEIPLIFCTASLIKNIMKVVKRNISTMRCGTGCVDHLCSVQLCEAVFPKVELDLDPLRIRCVYVVSLHFIGGAARVCSTVMGLGTTVVLVLDGMNCVFKLNEGMDILKCLPGPRAMPSLIPWIPCTQLYEPLIFGVDKDLGGQRKNARKQRNRLDVEVRDFRLKLINPELSINNAFAATLETDSSH